jgi:hypothetical protein
VCPKNVKRCVVIHSAREGSLFRHWRRRRQLAAAASGEGPPGSGGRLGGFAGRRGRALQAGGCNVTSPPPLVRWSNSEYGMVEIYPGKWNPVDMMFYQWEAMAVKYPTYEGLKHAYEVGKLDGAAWAKQELGLAAPAP